MEDPDPAAKKRKLEEAAAPAAAEPEAAVVAEQGAGDAAALEALMEAGAALAEAEEAARVEAAVAEEAAPLAASAEPPPAEGAPAEPAEEAVAADAPLAASAEPPPAEAPAEPAEAAADAPLAASAEPPPSEGAPAEPAEEAAADAPLAASAEPPPSEGAPAEPAEEAADVEPPLAAAAEPPAAAAAGVPAEPAEEAPAESAEPVAAASTDASGAVQDPYGAAPAASDLPSPPEAQPPRPPREQAPPASGPGRPPAAEATSGGATSSRASGTGPAPIEVDLTDDIVPTVFYDDKKSVFSKDGRWILPKRAEFPSVFCALRVQVVFDALAADANGAARDPAELDDAAIEGALRDDIGFGKMLVRWDDVRAAGVPARRRKVLASVNGSLPSGVSEGSVVEVQRLGVSCKITDVAETCDDIDPKRIVSLSRYFHESLESDVIVFEVPQLWIIPDPDFVAKKECIGLYPGSFWMGFLNAWGPVVTAMVYFRNIKKKVPKPMCNLLVKYKDRESLKMCYTFLFERYLVHPKEEDQLFPPACRLTTMTRFKSELGAAAGKAAAKAPVGGKAGVLAKRIPAAKKAAPGKAVAKVPAKAITKMPAKVKAAAPLMMPTATKSAAPAARKSAGLAPPPAKVRAPTPTEFSEAPMYPSPPPPKKGLLLPKSAVQRAGPAGSEEMPDQGHGESGDGHAEGPLTPAEAMRVLSGKQREAFEMAMSRMERLERENQELMEILLQMQSLLQQQQQRNARLTQLAGLSASGTSSGPAAMGVAPAVASATGALQAASVGQAPPQAPPRRPASRGLATAAAAQSGPAAAGELAAAAGLAADEAAHYAMGAGEEGASAEAPWVRQRKRPRRTPRVGAGAAGKLVAAGAAADGRGAALASYHNALLGV